MRRLELLIGNEQARGLQSRLRKAGRINTFSDSELVEFSEDLFANNETLRGKLSKGGEAAVSGYVKRLQQWCRRALKYNLSLRQIADEDLFLRGIADAIWEESMKEDDDD